MEIAAWINWISSLFLMNLMLILGPGEVPECPSKAGQARQKNIAGQD
jgi:hypothetical protein